MPENQDNLVVPDQNQAQPVQPTPPIATPPLPASPSPVQSPVQPQPAPSKKSKKALVIIIVSVLLLVAVAVSVSVFLFMKSEESSTGGSNLSSSQASEDKDVQEDSIIREISSKLGALEYGTGIRFVRDNIPDNKTADPGQRTTFSISGNTADTANEFEMPADVFYNYNWVRSTPAEETKLQGEMIQIVTAAGLKETVSKKLPNAAQSLTYENDLVLCGVTYSPASHALGTICVKQSRINEYRVYAVGAQTAFKKQYPRGSFWRIVIQKTVDGQVIGADTSVDTDGSGKYETHAYAIRVNGQWTYLGEDEDDRAISCDLVNKPEYQDMYTGFCGEEFGV